MRKISLKRYIVSIYVLYFARYRDNPQNKYFQGEVRRGEPNCNLHSRVNRKLRWDGERIGTRN